jgi:hypothetical protein
MIALACLPRLILPVNTGFAIGAYPLKSIFPPPNFSQASST